MNEIPPPSGQSDLLRCELFQRIASSPLPKNKGVSEAEYLLDKEYKTSAIFKEAIDTVIKTIEHLFHKCEDKIS